MPEEEVQEQKPVQEAAPAGFLGGVKGWIILVGSQLLWVAVLIVLLHYKTDTRFKKQAQGKNRVRISIKEYNRFALRLKDLNYSVRLQTGQVATLAMDLQIVLGLFPDEIEKEITISDEDWGKYMAALQAMDPDIRDMLQRYISQQTYAQLNSTAGREKIKAEVKHFVNEHLKEIDLGLSAKAAQLPQDRVQKVLFINYYMQ